MRRLLLSVCLVVLCCCGCAKSDRKYHDVELRVGMTKSGIVDTLGQPDSYDAYSTGGSEVINGKSVLAPYEGHFVEHLKYAPLSEHNQKKGQPTAYLLYLKFVGGQLQSWSKK